MGGEGREEMARGIEERQEMREALFREVEEILRVGRTRYEVRKRLVSPVYCKVQLCTLHVV